MKLLLKKAINAIKKSIAHRKEVRMGSLDWESGKVVW